MSVTTNAIRVIAVVCAVGMCSAVGSHAQTLSPYSVFASMSQSQLQTLQVKLTVVGDRLRPTATVLCRAGSTIPNVTVFQPFYRSTFGAGGYNNDYQKLKSFITSTGTLKAMIDSVGSVAEVTDGGVDSAGSVSFAMSNIVNDSTRVFESVVNPTSGKKLFGKLLTVFSGNDTATALLIGMGCGRGMLPGGPPSDVSSSVSIALRGFRKDRSTGRYVGSVRITNTGAQALSAPLIFVFDPPPGATVVGASGLTCVIDPAGWPYMQLPGTGLSVGQHVDLTLRFDNADDEPLDLVGPKVFSGPGFR